MADSAAMRRAAPPTARRAAGATTALAGFAALAALTAGCGGDPAPSGKYGHFTDCAEVGRVTRSTDPAGDQRGGPAGGQAEPHGDLVGVALARGGGRLCVEFRARAPIRPTSAFVVVLRPARGERPVVQLEATVLAGEPPAALLDDGVRRGFRDVDAAVGIDGDRLSIAVERAVLAEHGAGAVFDAFRYQARAAVVAADDRRWTDCAPGCS